MINVLRQHLISRLGNDIDQIDTVLSSFTPLYTKKSEFLVKEGTVCKYVYFVVKGCLQVFVHDGNMSEVTRDIVTEGTWCSELSSFGSGKPASENIRTVEPCELLIIDQANFRKLVQTVPQFDKVYKQLLEISYANAVFRMNSFVALSALDRMKWLMNQRPDLMTRVSSKLIASYLGIHKDVYSRLKAQL